MREGDRIESRLLATEREVAIIPSLAIHMNRGVNEGFAPNRAVDLCPLISAGELKQGDFDALIADELDVEPEQILGRDLFLVNRQDARIWGWADEFISTPKLDDLACAYTSLQAFLGAENAHDISVFCCFDNEEVGSETKQGAMSTFLAVIKEAANQHYCTDAFSRAVFQAICDDADVPTQAFANKSDMAGGSTLGNLSNMQASMHAVDVGLPQLAMHSSYETGGVRDVMYAIRSLTAFYERDLNINGAESVEL